MGFLDEHIKNYQIFLGSRSPRRKQLLEGLGLNFEIWVKEELTELYPAGMKPWEIAEYLAKVKARPYKNELVQGDILITADTIVCDDDTIFGKPGSRKEAFDFLSNLSGRKHKVITGVCISSPDECYCFYSETLVKFAVLDAEEIDYYIDNYAPFDKAGAYGIQEWIGYIGVESIQGSYFNVMGLPVQRLYAELKKFTGFSK